MMSFAYILHSLLSNMLYHGFLPKSQPESDAITVVIVYDASVFW